MLERPKRVFPELIVAFGVLCGLVLIQLSQWVEMWIGKGSGLYLLGASVAVVALLVGIPIRWARLGPKVKEFQSRKVVLDPGLPPAECDHRWREAGDYREGVHRFLCYKCAWIATLEGEGAMEEFQEKYKGKIVKFLED